MVLRAAARGVPRMILRFVLLANTRVFVVCVLLACATRLKFVFHIIGRQLQACQTSLGVIHILHLEEIVQKYE